MPLLLSLLLPVAAAVCDVDSGAPVALSPDGFRLAWVQERALCVQSWQTPSEPALELSLSVELPTLGVPPVWTGEQAQGPGQPQALAQAHDGLVRRMKLRRADLGAVGREGGPGRGGLGDRPAQAVVGDDQRLVTRTGCTSTYRTKRALAREWRAAGSAAWQTT